MKYVSKFFLSFSLVFTVIFLVGCNLGAEETESLSDSKGDGKERVEIKVNEKTLMVEVADSPEERSKGLMHRESMEDNHGMLFVFDNEQQLSFWMKNTLIPLSIGFFSKDGKLVDIQDMEPESVLVRELKVYKSTAPAKYALETNVGWFKKNGIEVGAQLFYKSVGNQTQRKSKSKESPAKSKKEQK